MSRPGGLGKGLGALIPTESEGQHSGPFRLVSVDDISANKFQPRDQFGDDSLSALADSIRELGVLQPLLVRRAGDGFELIAGERRWRAAQMVGLSEVPVIVRDADDMESLEQALVENLHRDDLNALEEAAAYQQLVDEFAMTQQQVARRVGRSRSAVANTLRLLGLPTSVQKMVSDGRLSAGHARALLGVDVDKQETVAKQVIRDDLTVRQLEKQIKSASGAGDEGGDEPPTIGKTRDPAVLELEELLSERLATRVSVHTGNRGKIVVEFADLDDLERIYHVITGR